VLDADDDARGDDGPALLGSLIMPGWPALPLRPSVVENQLFKDIENLRQTYTFCISSARNQIVKSTVVTSDCAFFAQASWLD
jgi:hypothetical protein